MDDTTTPQTGGTTEDGGAQGNAQNSAHGSDEMAALKQELALAKEQIEALTVAAKGALADLQNYRKRTEEEKKQFMEFATLSLIQELLPILDNFGRAFGQVPESIRSTEWFKGALQIEQQLVGIMKKRGVVEAPSAIGKPLDTRLQEAVTSGPGEQGLVIDEYEKAYLIGDKVIRPAKVIVGTGEMKNKDA